MGEPSIRIGSRDIAVLPCRRRCFLRSSRSVRPSSSGSGRAPSGFVPPPSTTLTDVVQAAGEDAVTTVIGELRVTASMLCISQKSDILPRACQWSSFRRGFTSTSVPSHRISRIAKAILRPQLVADLHQEHRAACPPFGTVMPLPAAYLRRKI